MEQYLEDYSKNPQDIWIVSRKCAQRFVFHKMFRVDKNKEFENDEMMKKYYDSLQNTVQYEFGIIFSYSNHIPNGERTSFFNKEYARILNKYS